VTRAKNIDVEALAGKSVAWPERSEWPAARIITFEYRDFPLSAEERRCFSERQDPCMIYKEIYYV